MNKKIYRMQWLPFFLIWNVVLTGAILFLFILMIHNPGETTLSKIQIIFLVGIYMICSISVFVSALVTRVVVSTDGVAFYANGFHIYTPWDNIMGITQIKYPIFPFHVTPVFILHQPALLHISLDEGRQRRLAVIEKYWKMRILAVKPQVFMCYLPMPKDIVSRIVREQGELGSYIRQHTPHLLEAMRYL